MERPWRALAVLCLANFLILLDTTIVNTAAPDVMAGLDAGIDEVLWVLNGYLLAFASLLIVFGRVGDLVGPRAVFVAGLTVFTAASILCGLSTSSGVLIAARVLQGVGAAALTPQALTLISAIFPAQRRGAAFGIFTAVAGVAAVSGPTVGGLVVTEYGWQSVFWLNVPFGAAGVVLALRFVPDLRAGRRHRFDAVGVVLATGALLALVYALVEGQRHDWGVITGVVSIPAVLVLSAVLGAAFLWWERRQHEPLVPLDLFRDRNYSVATGITLISSFAVYGLLLVFVIETQTLLGMSPLMSGVTALPWTIALSAVAPLGGRLADRVGGKLPLTVGMALYAAGVLGVAFVPDATSTPGTFVVPMLLAGIGMGLALAPATTEAMRDIPAERAGVASGVLNTARQTGAALGAAVIGAVLQNRLVSTLHAESASLATRLPPQHRPRFLDAFEDAAAHGLRLGTGQQGVAVPDGLPPDTAAQFSSLAHQAFTTAFLTASRSALAVAAAAILLGGLSALMLNKKPTTTSQIGDKSSNLEEDLR
ncbi:DHA2 family efflux MFS transporter permease subunit [Saccharothrix variisporea]|uniref:EmrB/QacA subfamily drug resistance transporter n=1 Tax=Saccharothrix variisporea TaxID=543527 RepID=A0A495WZZ8_9PSEU|nr:DHA2 family efflux MFS transporter permease subunit [Saccharothrix variisporea]RKT66979.1 EmrB/QacA subfamily drug resistance transporter [Saccharothrix variisporea]